MTRTARQAADGWGKPAKVLLLRPSALELDDDSDSVKSSDPMGSVGSVGSEGVLRHQDAESIAAGHGIGEENHGIGWDRRQGVRRVPIPSDPIRSHAWDRKNDASGRAESASDPTDPMKNTDTPDLQNPDSGRWQKPSTGWHNLPMPPNGFPLDLWLRAVRAWQADRMEDVAAVARERRMDYSTLMALIRGALDADAT